MAASSNESLDILESALDQAFSAPLPTVPQEVPQEVSATEQSDSSQFESVEESNLTESSVVEVNLSESTVSNDSWKEEYEAQVKSWRARSAEEREKAEKERLRWEAIRAIEKEEAAKRKAAGIVDEPVVAPTQPPEEKWEDVKTSSETTPETPASKVETAPSNIKEASELKVPSSPTPPLPRTVSHQDTATTTDDSQKWEDVPSVTSSFPSMSFPENIEASTPANREQPAPAPAPVSVSLAIFDSSLSTRTRVTALISSLAVNLFLPFVNGVMLGFGEIFAKDVVMRWLGWKPSGPASTVTNVGLRSSSREERQRNAFR
ncbi:Mitochondrial import protein 1 [Psilocybe cubensis]|uniref:Mitochondrial import protein 1 n=2 Tax=Psilocybe cubensis TaxID=181762 RepID=A0ACB8H0R0_PSICU|nr:Mitochondrial import protein 1 [Psilocybe cubensis]KAH9481446.1 Mitochondrial import protein 1 [Psilocybe cubensis]